MPTPPLTDYHQQGEDRLVLQLVEHLVHRLVGVGLVFDAELCDLRKRLRRRKHVAAATSSPQPRHPPEHWYLELLAVGVPQLEPLPLEF
ncbi:threonine-tRNA ligase [Babesia caballi]|uniref:Threonine-tRNA ligase n=1 Tax=Babesia caballi TaxID=5871 RepID=A0AAV4M176_BABCB|nr:threonine-tRNA ligase [Babesia caballi]